MVMSCARKDWRDASLTAEERASLLLKEMTLEEIGERLDLTRERVRQIKEKAIRKLKKPSASKLLKTYLG